MSEWQRSRTLGKRDDSEAGIIQVFLDAGASIVRHGGKDEPDLFIGYLGRTYPVEVKSGKRPKLSKGQIEWAACWQGDPVQTCRSVADAVDLIHVWNRSAAVEHNRKIQDIDRALREACTK